MNKYIGHSLEELSKAANEYFIRHRDNGGASEFDSSINDISRATIDAFHLKHGKCFLGRVNLYDNERENITEYQFTVHAGQLVYNFEYAFVIPHPDEELLQLIIEYNLPKETFNSQDTWNRVKQIFARIERLGGISLTWS